MFYSQQMLSKKGALGIVWMAAHCLKRLKKEQLQQTNISSSVDKILDDEVPTVTHRILAFLLLGVVRIYSKKVEYLFHDSHEILNKLCGLTTGKGKSAAIGISRLSHRSISLPKRFELDAFDLELPEDQDLVGENVRLNEQLMIADGGHEDGNTHGLLGKEIVLFSGAHTLPRHVLSPGQMEQHFFASTSRNFQGPANDMEIDSSAGASYITSHPTPTFEILRGTSFSLEDRLDPMVLDEHEKEQLNNRPSSDNIRTNFSGSIQDVEFYSVSNLSLQGTDSVASLGTFNKSGSSLEHSPDFEMLNEAEIGQGHDERSDDEHGVEEEQLEHLITRLKFQPLDLTRSADKAQPEGVGKMKNLSIVLPDSKLPAAGVGTPEVAKFQTPATKERAKRKKQKILFDSTTMMSAKDYRSWLEDPSDLKRERRKVPYSLLHARRAHKLGNVPQSFFEPLFPGISINLVSQERQESYAAAIKSVELYACHDDVISPERTATAPPTSFSHFNLLTACEDGAAANQAILEPTTSLEHIENSPFSSDGLKFDTMFQEETNALDRDHMENDAYSTRTRMIESYLSSKFLEKKRKKEEEVVNLSQLLAGKTKKASARMFYDILVLKMRDSIDVQQENAYDDILLRETSKFEEN